MSFIKTLIAILAIGLFNVVIQPAQVDPLPSYFLELNLQKEIAKRGLKQTWIAEQLGISAAYLTLILQNKRNLKRNPELKKRLINVITGRLS